MELSTNSLGASASLSSSALERSSAESANSPGKTRSACNRCHQQKLRCVRNVGQAGCERCLRLKTSCRFGPRVSRSSPKGPEQATDWALDVRQESTSTAEYTIPIEHSNTLVAKMSEWQYLPIADTAMIQGQGLQPALYNPLQSDYFNMQDTSWLDCYGSSDLNLTSVNENPTITAENLLSIITPDPYRRIEDLDSNGNSEISPVSSVRKLADLNVALGECAIELPPMAREDRNPSGFSNSQRSAHGSRKVKLFAVDELFRLTNEIINVFRGLSLVDQESNESLSPIHPPPMDLLFLSGPRRSDAGLSIAESPARSFSHLDEATVFMIMSCHSRLTEIYQSIFQMVQGCIEHSLVPQVGNDWAIVLPKLQMGSISSPPVQVDINTPLSPGTYSMYLPMITMLTSQLLEPLVKLVHDVPTDSKFSSRLALVDTIWQTMRTRTDRLWQTIDDTKNLLQRHYDARV